MGRWLDLRMLNSNMMGKRFLSFRVDREVSRVMSGGEVRRRTEKQGFWFKDKGQGAAG